MRWMRDCWDSATAQTVTNCWRHTGLIEQDRIAAGKMEKEIRGTGTSSSAVVNLSGVEAALLALVSPQVRARMAIANLVSPEGENDCHEVVDINSLVNEAAESIGGHSQGEEEVKSPVLSLLDSVSLQERLKAVVIVRQLLAEKDCIDSVFSSTLRTLQRDIRLRRSRTARQQQITLQTFSIKMYGYFHCFKHGSFMEQYLETEYLL